MFLFINQEGPECLTGTRTPADNPSMQEEFFRLGHDKRIQEFPFFGRTRRLGDDQGEVCRTEDEVLGDISHCAVLSLCAMSVNFMRASCCSSF